ncbi:sugar transferase [Paenibacillus sp. YYML68]|uniref:sugar transferase n=1 Tax=Paenibacillus sp. YYML68 TaxID=2909250 RepID=UPI00248FEDCC|nr:sugar transferase [Paenibacillus sp. YYML68]
MHRSNLLAFANLWQLFIDVGVLVASFVAAYGVTQSFTFLYDFDRYVWILIVFVPTWVFTMNVQRMYNSTTFTYPDRLVRSTLFASLISCLILTSLIFFIKETYVSRMLIGTYVGLASFLLLTARFVYIFLVMKLNAKSGTKVVIVGTPQLAKRFRAYIAKTNVKIHILGHIQIYPDKKLKKNYHLGYLSELEDLLKNNVVDEVIFALPRTYVNRIEPYILQCEEMGITVRMILDLYNLRFSKIHQSSIGTFPMLTFHSVTINRFNLMLKRIIDVIGAIVGLFLTALLCMVIVPAIMLESKGPAVFTQNRVGLNGRTFKIYKFRSMYIDAEERKQKLMAQNQVNGGFMFKMKDDPRITRVGKFLRKTSLDEFPQFLNVLRGEMSLVGTRPPTLDEVSRYETYHRRRLSFKPGLTGMWQVNGRSDITDFEEVVRLDTSYIDQWSLWLDVKIILKTVKSVLTPRSGAM